VESVVALPIVFHNYNAYHQVVDPLVIPTGMAALIIIIIINNIINNKH